MYVRTKETNILISDVIVNKIVLSTVWGSKIELFLINKRALFCFTKEGYIVIASYKYFKYKVLYIIDKKKINILGLHTAKDL